MPALIDTRVIPGNGGAVELFADDFGGFFVVVSDHSQKLIASIGTKSRKEAADAFLHTFARRDVPDVFKHDREDAGEYDEDKDDQFSVLA